MVATLGEPYLLSSYDYPAGKGVNSSHVYVHTSQGISGGTLAIVSVQQDSVYALDLASLHTTSSINLSPSDVLSTPSISRTELSADGKSIRATYVPLHSKGEGKGSRLSRWEQVLNDSSEQLPQEQATRKLPWKVHHLATSPALPQNIIAISEAGDIIISDITLKTVSTIPAIDKSRSRIRTFVFDHSPRKFPELENVSSSVIVVSVFQVEKGCDLDIVSVSQNGSKCARISSLSYSVSGVLDAVVGISGHFSLFTSDAKLYYGQIVSDGKQLSISPQMQITNFMSDLFIKISEKQTVPSRGFSMLGLSDTHILLAFLSPMSEPHIQLLLWDLKFSVVLASFSAQIPPSLSIINTKQISISLIPATSDSCILLISPVLETGQESRIALHTVLQVLPFTCPAMSTVATAMGCSKDTQKWLLLEDPVTSKTIELGERLRGDLLSRLEAELSSNNVQAADDVFFEWIASEESKLDPKDVSSIVFAKTSYGRGKTPAAPTLKPKKESKTAVLPYKFMTKLLGILLSANRSTSPKILAYLIERQAVSQNMLEGGVTNRLKELNDWVSIDLALKNIHDLSEADISSLIRAATDKHLTPSRSGDVTMDVDSDSPASRLTRVLSRALRYPTTEASMRLALRRDFKDLQHLMPILNILDNWLDRWAERGPLLGFSLEGLETGEHLFHNKKDTNKMIRNIEKRTGIPAPEHIIHFLRIILDSFFLQLIQTSEIMPVLQRLREKVTESLQAQKRLEALRGPLEPFMKLILSEELDPTLRKTARTPLPTRTMPLKLYQIEHITV